MSIRETKQVEQEDGAFSVVSIKAQPALVVPAQGTTSRN